jgi:Fe-S-cluster containining protein
MNTSHSPISVTGVRIPPTTAQGQKAARRIRLPLHTISRLDELYAQIPPLACQKKCQECCGPIMMGQTEWDRIRKHLAYEPRPAYSKDLTIRGMIMGIQPPPDVKVNLDCPLLTADGLCKVYAIRPAICRLWGIVPSMVCPHGCVPEGGHWTEEKGKEWMDEILRCQGEK